MRIAISTSVIQRGKTGVAQYTFALLKALCAQAKNHQFILFVLEEDLPLFDFAKTKMEIVPVSENFRAPVKNILWHQTKLPALVRQYKIDVLHVPSYRRMLFPKPCALVTTIHDLAAFHVANKYDWKRMFYGRVVAKQFARRQDEIIAISENTARDLERFFRLSRKKISIIHNGLDAEHFNRGSKEAAKRFVAQKHKIATSYFLYLARLEHPAKNHVRLIRAFNRFKAETKSDWKLVFSGSDWHGAEIIHRIISQSPFAHDIHSLGFVSSIELPDLYRAADIFIYPSLFEGFGLPPVEAMACGCPVISSPSGSLAEIVGDAALIIDPENVNDLKQKMMTLSADAALREKYREAGFLRAKCFDWNKAAEATLAVYDRVFARVNKRESSSLRSSLPLQVTKV